MHNTPAKCSDKQGENNLLTRGGNCKNAVLCGDIIYAIYELNGC